MALTSDKAVSRAAESAAGDGPPASGEHRIPTIPYRGDIDGVRAIAVALVVLYHAGTPGFSGGYIGVDVFFVISGFLITSVLVAQGESDRFSLVGFYAGRIRRLLPLSILTLITTVAFGVWLLPSTRATELVADARSSLLYVSNWRFADKAVAYGETEVSEGMLTHFWSLSVEEQYYFGWPLLIAGAVLLVRFVPRFTLRATVLGLAVAVTIVSLWMSVQVTPTEGSRAYYLTHLRLWEIAAGAVVAVLPLAVRGSARASAVVQVAAVAAIVAVAATYDDLTAFPGSAAIVPVVATVALILFGGGGNVVDRVLVSTPMKYVGERSYAWYLWHWPALGVADLLARKYGWGLNHAVLIACAIAVSFVLAVASHRLVENPIRYSLALRRLPRSSVLVGAVCTVALALSTIAVRSMILDASARVWADAVVTPEEAVEDTASRQFRECHNGMGQQLENELVTWCEAGDPAGTTTIALVGDSHAQHWAPAFDEAGQTNGWRVLITTRSSCPLYDLPTFNGRLEVIDEGCRTWGRAVEEALAAEGGVDLVAVGRARGYARAVRTEDGDVPADPDIERALTVAVDRFATATLEHSGAVLIIPDTPWAPYRVPDCLLESSPREASSCDFEARTTALEVPLLAAERAAVEATESDRDSVTSLSSIVCPGGLCEAVNPDGLITYRDQSHMSAAYSRSLGEDLSRVLQRLIDE